MGIDIEVRAQKGANAAALGTISSIRIRHALLLDEFTFVPSSVMTEKGVLLIRTDPELAANLQPVLATNWQKSPGHGRRGLFCVMP
jgi:hypothetical protein